MTLTTCDKVPYECSMGKKCCMKTKKTEDDVEDSKTNSSDFLPYDPSQEPIFPPELIVRNKFLYYILYKRVLWFFLNFSLQKNLMKSI